MIGSIVSFKLSTRWLLLVVLSATGLASVPAADKDHPAESLQGTLVLFNGRDLAGWIPVGKGASGDWSVRDGCIVCNGKGHTWLRTARQYGDFHREFEPRVSPGANSGVYVRVGTDGNHHRESATAPPAGFEVQILDDRAPRYAGLKDYQFCASLYDIAGASSHVSKPAGEWNSLEIQCAGMHVTARHNGVLVVDADPD